MNPHQPYASVVFAGGGNRCIWQAGFWETVAPLWKLTPRSIAAVSAGANIACLLFSGKTLDAMIWMKKATATLSRNVYPEHLLSHRPIFPHGDVYRNLLREIFDDSSLAAIKKGPEIRILLARPPMWMGPRMATLVGFSAYGMEKRLTKPLHPRLPRLLGFRAEAVSVRECRNAHELTRLILASSCTPPILPPMKWKSRWVLDGGLVDNVPVHAIRPEEIPCLILLTRRYPAQRIRGIAGRTYIQPSRPIPVSKWDYTHPESLQAAWDLGRRDGERFLASGPPSLQI